MVGCREGIVALKSSVPLSASERIESIDIVRGLALFGVLIVNLVFEFRVSIFQQFLGPSAPQTMWDRFVETGIALIFSMKAFALFSLLFGVGLAIQFDRLSKGGEAIYRLTCRLFILLVFGLVHLVLIWNGDILIEYAIGGLLMLPLLYARSGMLALASAIIFALYLLFSVVPLPIAWPSQTWMLQHVADANRVYASGDFAEVLRFRIGELRSIMALHAYVFPRTLALFVLGAIAWRSGMLSEPERFKQPLRWIAFAGLGVGFALAVADAFGGIAAWSWLGPVRLALPNFGTTMLALGYGAAMVLALQFPVVRRFFRPVASMGRMAFTNYIMQSVVFGWIFYGYGLGLFGKLGAGVTLLIGVAVYAMQIIGSAWWLRSHHFGPLEWLWRSLMYGDAQPMRRSSELAK